MQDVILGLKLPCAIFSFCIDFPRQGQNKSYFHVNIVARVLIMFTLAYVEVNSLSQ